MSLGMVYSAALHGMEVKFIRVEADLSNGLPMFHMVGYLSSEVKEAGDIKIQRALTSSQAIYCLSTMCRETLSLHHQR